jgi:hypothetical protein
VDVHRDDTLPSEDALGKETALAVAAKELSATGEEDSDVVDTRD